MIKQHLIQQATTSTASFQCGAVVAAVWAPPHSEEPIHLHRKLISASYI